MFRKEDDKSEFWPNDNELELDDLKDDEMTDFFFDKPNQLVDDGFPDVYSESESTASSDCQANQNINFEVADSQEQYGSSGNEKEANEQTYFSNKHYPSRLNNNKQVDFNDYIYCKDTKGKHFIMDTGNSTYSRVDSILAKAKKYFDDKCPNATHIFRRDQKIYIHFINEEILRRGVTFEYILKDALNLSETLTITEIPHDKKALFLKPNSYYNKIYCLKKLKEKKMGMKSQQSQSSKKPQPTQQSMTGYFRVHLNPPSLPRQLIQQTSSSEEPNPYKIFYGNGKNG